MPQFQAFYEDFQDEVMLLGVDIGVFTGLGKGMMGKEKTPQL